MYMYMLQLMLTVYVRTLYVHIVKYMVIEHVWVLCGLLWYGWKPVTHVMWGMSRHYSSYYTVTKYFFDTQK